MNESDFKQELANDKKQEKNCFHCGKLLHEEEQHKMDIIDQSVNESVCKVEVSFPFVLCNSCLEEALTEAGYEHCEGCGRYAKEMVSSICTYKGSREDPPEYEDMCESCADRRNDRDV